MVKITFHDNCLCERGTTISLYDYAYYNKHYLGNESIIMYDGSDHRNVKEVIDKFSNEFKLCPYENWNQDANKILQEEKCDILYMIKAGEFDGKMADPDICKSVVHCVFHSTNPHGHIYSTIAPWVHHNNGQFPFVPHMINLPDIKGDMRKELGIPEDAIVLGRHGGYEQFDIEFALKTIEEIATNNSNIYFLLVNTKQFCKSLPNIIHLEKIINLDEKVKFINSCDGMMWARSDGEVFSLSQGEFSFKNKPIICMDIGYRGHVQLLKDKAMWYKDSESLKHILLNFKEIKQSKSNWNAYEDYTPEKVMDIFNKVYIDPVIKNNNDNKIFIEKITKKKYNLSEGWENMTINLRNYLENEDIDAYRIKNIIPNIFHWPEKSGQNIKQLELLSKDKTSKFYQTIINNNDYGPTGIYLYKGVQLDRVQQTWSIYNLVEILNLDLDKDEIIFEFGGGTGQMCDVLKDLNFKGKHIVYDLPLIGFLQKHFVEKRKIAINYILDGVELEIINGTNYLPCNQIDSETEIMKMDNINFIATFSLTETDIETHNRFFKYMKNFSRLYIVYSLNQTVTEDYIDNHSYILEIIENIKDTHKYHIRDNYGNGRAFYAVKKTLIDGIK